MNKSNFMMSRVFLLMVLTGLLAADSMGVTENPQQRYLVVMRSPEQVWNQARPETINPDSFREVTDCFAVPEDGNVRLGLAFILSYFKTNRDLTVACLHNLLECAEKTDTPIMIKLDGEHWWQARPDLWNWWDPSQPGYDPGNRLNVEWTWWQPEFATKIAWRNWGRQLRVDPAPNLMSATYRQACHEEMDVLVPIVMRWYKQLPPDKKYLFVGLNVGWESSIGTSEYYYPNGNDLLQEPESDDPQRALIIQDVLDRGMVQIGYAAVKTAGLRSHGDITEADLAEVARRHLADLSKKAAELGVPRELLFTHGVGYREHEMLFRAAVNEHACPGWSSYYHSPDIVQDKSVMTLVDESDAPHWASVEWLLLLPFERQAWQDAIGKTMRAPGLKFMCIYNWELIHESDDVKEAIQNVLDQGRSQ